MASAEDRIVRELDVFLFNEFESNGCKTVLFQYPLRAMDRPYVSGFSSIKHKPRHGRVRAEVPLDVEAPQYDPQSAANVGGTVESLTLEGQVTDSEGDLAAGYLDGDRLVLFPVTAVAAMRPALDHLSGDGAGGAGAAAGKPDPGAAHGAPTELTVTVERRETAAQREARERSYAHLAQLEAAEPWSQLRYHGPGSKDVQQRFARVQDCEGEPIADPIAREEYLDALLPLAPDASAEERVDATRAPGGLQGGDRSAARGHELGPLPAEHVAPLLELLPPMLRETPMLGARALRRLLAKAPTAGRDLVSAVERTSDSELLVAAASSGDFEDLRGRLIRHKTDESSYGMRKVVVAILRSEGSLRKSDVKSAATAAGVEFSEHQFGRIVREFCINIQARWVLKTDVPGG